MRREKFSPLINVRDFPSLPVIEDKPDAAAFVANTLGPTSSFGVGNPQPLGGAVKTVGSFELAFPKLVNAPGTRLSAFVDYGYVFTRPGEFKLNQFRTSAGIALQWQSPVGPISISYSVPLNYDTSSCAGPTCLDTTKDQVERLQFTFGQQY